MKLIFKVRFSLPHLGRTYPRSVRSFPLLSARRVGYRLVQCPDVHELSEALGSRVDGIVDSLLFCRSPAPGGVHSSLERPISCLAFRGHPCRLTEVLTSRSGGRYLVLSCTASTSAVRWAGWSSGGFFFRMELEYVGLCRSQISFFEMQNLCVGDKLLLSPMSRTAPHRTASLRWAPVRRGGAHVGKRGLCQEHVP